MSTSLHLSVILVGAYLEDKNHKLEGERQKRQEIHLTHEVGMDW
jgi:hypothetical protein